MTARELPTPDCPTCGAPLQLVVVDGQVARTVVSPFHRRGAALPKPRMIDRPFLACSTCEFCIEVEL